MRKTAALNILSFGPAREVVGANKVTFSMSVPCSVGDLRIELLNAFPSLGTLQTLRIAVDQAYSNDDRMIQGDEEIAIILPVSGG